MATTSTAVATVEPVFTEPERLALAGFLAGYTGLTREAYALDLGLRPRIADLDGILIAAWPAGTPDGVSGVAPRV